MYARKILTKFILCLLLLVSIQQVSAKVIGGYPLVNYIEKGDQQKIDEFIIAKKNENNGSIGNIGDIVIKAVIAKEYNKVLTHFLNEGYDPNSVFDKMSPIHLAASSGNLEAIKLLLKFGANINMQDSEGHTALYYSNQEGYEEITRYLLQHGIKTSAPYRRPNYPEDVGREHLKILDKTTTSNQHIYPTEDLNSKDFSNSERLQFMHQGKFDSEETVWSSKTDGTDLRQVLSQDLLYKHQQNAGDPSVAGVFRSPNRRYLIVFLDDRNNLSQINLIDLVAKTSRRIIQTELERNNIKAFWKPDSSQVSFTVYYNSDNRNKLITYDLVSNTISSIIDPKYYADAYDSKTKTHYIIREEFISKINNDKSKQKIIGNWKNCCNWSDSRSYINLKNKLFLSQGYKQSIISSINNNELNLVYEDKIEKRNPIFSSDGKTLYYHDFDSLNALSIPDKTTKTLVTPVRKYGKIYNLTLLPPVNTAIDSVKANPQISDSSLQIINGGVLFNGTLVNGKPEGFGKWQYQLATNWKGDKHKDIKNRIIAYEGDFKNGQFHGKGKALWLEGQSYQGEWTKGIRSGNGTYISVNENESFIGNWIDDKKHGSGKCGNNKKYICDFHLGKKLEYSGERNSDGQKHGIGTGKWNDNEYTGQWTNDEVTGNGIFKPGYSNKSYKGNFIKGKLNGHGEYKTPWISYIGEFKDNEFHGNGKISWRTGQTYTGQWINGKQTGNGTYISNDNNENFDGGWLNGEKHGSGLCGKEKTPCNFYRDYPMEYTGDRNTNGQKHGIGTGKWNGNEYTGQWTEDEITGQGKLQKEGTEGIFSGTFVNGKLNGHGEYNAEKISYSGEWKDGLYDGEGTLTKWSRTYKGLFEKGRFIQAKE